MTSFFSIQTHPIFSIPYIKRNFVKFLVLLLLVHSTSACKYHYGRIMDEKGFGIENATVTFADRSGKARSTTSGMFGWYAIDELPGYYHAVTGSAHGYLNTTVFPRTDDLARVNLKLKKNDFPEDSDGDGLSDGDEFVLGSDINSSDTDQDGLPDAMEASIVAPFTTLPLGTSATRRDIIVEFDWPKSSPQLKPIYKTVQLAKDTFAQAPVENPDGTMGINLIVDDGRFGGGGASNFGDEIVLGEDEFLDDFIDERRIPYVYHSVAVRRITAETSGVGGYAYRGHHLNIIGVDFSIIGQLGALPQATTWLHELGHNLSLMHGGNDDVLCKPNYPSVMNYSSVLTLTLDFSRGEFPTLNESALIESEGIGFGPVDWNQNFLIDEEPVSYNINGSIPYKLFNGINEQLELKNLPLVGAIFSGDNCQGDADDQVLSDFDDWSQILKHLPNHTQYGARPENWKMEAASVDREILPQSLLDILLVE